MNNTAVTALNTRQRIGTRPIGATDVYFEHFRRMMAGK